VTDMAENSATMFLNWQLPLNKAHVKLGQKVSQYCLLIS